MEPSNEENDDDELALLTKNFKKFLKNVGKNSKINSSSTKNTKGKTSSKSVDSSNKKGIQCRECEGYGHIQSECANTLKKKSKAIDRKSTRLNSSHSGESRMPSSA